MFSIFYKYFICFVLSFFLMFFKWDVCLRRETLITFSTSMGGWVVCVLTVEVVMLLLCSWFR
jgi:hypothetical protein